MNSPFDYNTFIKWTKEWVPNVDTIYLCRRNNKLIKLIMKCPSVDSEWLDNSYITYYIIYDILDDILEFHKFIHCNKIMNNNYNITNVNISYWRYYELADAVTSTISGIENSLKKATYDNYIIFEEKTKKKIILEPKPINNCNLGLPWLKHKIISLKPDEDFNAYNL